MNEKSKEILEEAGWYEGRKIDIEKFEMICREENIELINSVKRFLEEFGDLIINDEDGDPYHRFDRSLFYSKVISQTIGEPAMCVGTIDGKMFNLYISESGRVYDDHGYLGKDIYEAGDIILDTVDSNEAYKEIRKLWKDIGLEEASTEAYLDYYGGKKVQQRLLDMKAKGLTLTEIARIMKSSEKFVVKILNKKFSK